MTHNKLNTVLIKKFIIMKKNYFIKTIGVFAVTLFMLMSTNVIAQNKYALDFESTEYVYLNDQDDHLDVTTAWTFECWINVDAVSGYDDFMYRPYIFSFQVNDQNTPAGDFDIDFYNRNNSAQLKTTTENLVINTWYHVAATFDGSTAKLYVNGTLVNSDNTAANWLLITNNNDLFIGARVSNNQFDGQIDEVRLSNIARATTAMQLSTHEEEYISDANTVFLMHYDNLANPPDYVSGVSYSGASGDYNISSADYLYGEVASAKLLRPEYRSKATGNWNVAGSWEYDNTGYPNWVSAALTPSFYDDAITILNGHTITVSADVEIDQTTIASGGQVTVSNGNTLTINDGTGTDLTIDGTLKKEGTGAISYDVTAAMAFNSGGKFELAGTNKYIPVATWDDNSTCEITGAIGGDMTSTYHTNQTFGHFTWNCTGQTSNVFFSGALTSIDGDFTIVSTNSHELRLTGTTGGDPTVSVGDVDIQSGTLNLTSGDNNCYFVCNGSYSQSAGTTIKADGSGTGYLRPEDIQVNSSYSLTLASNMDIGTAPFTVYGTFTVPSSYTFTIPSGGLATLYGDMTVDGTLTNSEGNAGLVIKSNVNGTGSLIENDGASATVERYIVQYSDDDHGWHLLGSPVGTFAIDGSDFDPGDDPSGNDLYRWEESTAYWMNYKNGDPTQIVPGTGYLTAWETTDTKDFTGALNNSDVAISGLTYTSANDYTGAHLLGNPFPSAIKWNDGNWALNNISATAKVWNETSASYSDIATNGIIPSANGFMVEATAAAASLTIPKAARVHNDQAWYKNTDHYILLIARDLENNTAQETNIRINEQATNTYDPLFDSHFFTGFAPSFYSQIEGHALSTNTFPELSEELEIPLGFVKNDASQFTIELDLEKLMPETEVFLTDQKTGSVQDMVSNPVYQFTSFEGDEVSRFILKFTEANSISNTGNNDKFIVYTANGMVYINSQLNLDGEIKLVDLAGRTLSTTKLIDGSGSLNTNGKHGFFIVSVVSDLGVVNKKVFVK
ncbi:MAG: hypothetical protein B6I19_04990 [Bacteroidetes bacterium 4572_114]|nr:MAG: hypothetical protein B6I19_04990 [Bacteroidetes bacterium 4572_114]